MTDEEKKAIEKFKNFIYTYQDVIEDEYSDYEEKESAKEYQEVSEKILNLIEKQSKEIEELKEDSCCMTNCVRRDKEELFLEDKIKAKIESVDYSGHSKAERIAMKEVLQSLLEKE